MIKAILLDLDDTLLTCPDDIFVPAYFKAGSQYLAEKWQIHDIIPTLVAFTKQVHQKPDFHQSITQFANQMIATQTGQSSAYIEEAFNDFYTQCYPALQRYTQNIETAPAFVQWLLDKGFKVVIATNPLYPADPIQQRLAWAGLNPSPDRYNLITSSDNMHFAKPDPAYYMEIIARAGVEPDEALMIGNSLENDILPAQAAGLHTYHLAENPTHPDGALAECWQALRETEYLTERPVTPLTPTMIFAELTGNIGALFGFLKDVHPHYWNQHPDPAEWSIMEIICHLLDSENTTQHPRLQRILNENNPFLVNPQAPAGPNMIQLCDEDGYNAALRWAKRREETVQWLRTLSPEDWQRPANHSIFGPTTLIEMAHFTAQHDRLHLNQLCQTLGRCE
jgi:HAD superfamily hydrolase (TIGR01549 family)